MRHKRRGEYGGFEQCGVEGQSITGMVGPVLCFHGIVCIVICNWSPGSWVGGVMRGELQTGAGSAGSGGLLRRFEKLPMSLFLNSFKLNPFFYENML